MDFGHDTEFALGVVTDLVNTDLQTLDDLQELVDRHSVSGVDKLTADDLNAVRTLQPQLRAVFTAADERAAADLLNGLIAASGATPRLVNHDAYPLHLHYFAPGASLAEHLAADGSMALAFVVAAGEHDRLRMCEAPGCDRVLVDLSRNRSRRYCDARTCGNRLHVAAYRARRAGTVVS